MNSQRTVPFLMANLGSEVIRFFSLQKRGNHEYAKASAERAYLIMDTLTARGDIGNGKREVALLRMLVEDALSNSPQYRVSEKELNSYFMPFAEKVLSG